MHFSPSASWTRLAAVSGMCVLMSAQFSYGHELKGVILAKTGRQVAPSGGTAELSDERKDAALTPDRPAAKSLIIGEDGIAVISENAGPVALVGAHRHDIERPDDINTASINPAVGQAVSQQIGLHVVADPRMSGVKKFTAAGLEDMIIEISTENEVDPKLALTIAHIESSLNQFALSDDGAMGVMQLMPKTAEALGVENPWDARQNINGGVLYLKQLTAEFTHPLLVAAAYHSGPQAVHDAGGIPKGPRTAGYMVSLLNEFYDIYASSGAGAKAPVSRERHLSGVHTVALSAGKPAEENAAANGVGTWEQGFVLHLD